MLEDRGISLAFCCCAAFLDGVVFDGIIGGGSDRGWCHVRGSLKKLDCAEIFFFSFLFSHRENHKNNNVGYDIQIRLG